MRTREYDVLLNGGCITRVEAKTVKEADASAKAFVKMLYEAYSTVHPDTLLKLSDFSPIVLVPVKD